MLIKKILLGEKIRVGFIDLGSPHWDQPFLSKFSHKQISYLGQIESLSSHSTKVVSSFLLELINLLPDAKNKIELIHYPVDYLGSLDFCLNKMASMKLDFLNISLAGAHFYPDEMVLISKIRKKTILVFAAGNEGSPRLNYPCAYNLMNTVCVGNIDKSGKREPSSNYGTWVNTYEVGTDVSVFSSEAPKSEIDTGTSFSSPRHMAKLVASASLGIPFDYLKHKKEFVKQNKVLIRIPASKVSK